jgi:flagellar FliL protein
MANAETIEVESPPIVVANKKKGSKLMLIVGAVTLIALAAGGFMFMRMHAAQAKVPAVEVKPVEVYLPLDPAFVVNFQDDDATRYLQVGVTVMSHDPATIQSIKDNDPVIRNALVMLFSSQTFEALSSTAGKQKLQAEALTAVRKIVADKTAKGSVTALYFTSFVMQ